MQITKSNMPMMKMKVPLHTKSPCLALLLLLVTVTLLAACEASVNPGEEASRRYSLPTRRILASTDDNGMALYYGPTVVAHAPSLAPASPTAQATAVSVSTAVTTG
jgi:hypothetical protein